MGKVYKAPTSFATGYLRSKSTRGWQKTKAVGHQANAKAPTPTKAKAFVKASAKATKAKTEAARRLRILYSAFETNRSKH